MSLPKLMKPSRTLDTPIRLLVEGWFNIPHSYAIVCCNELLALERCYSEKDLEIYIKEEEYYRSHWKDNQKLVYTNGKMEKIRNFKVWKDEPIDIIYRITYPYNLELKKYNRYAGKFIPTVVFYTAEFSNLNVDYFKFNDTFKFVDDNFIKSFISNYPNFYFKTPSRWSQRGMNCYLESLETDRNKLISHGVDPNVFYKDTSRREELRSLWGFTSDCIVLMSGGALTRNKGVPETLALLYLLVFKYGKKHIRLVLKGTNDLYTSQRFVESYFDDLQNQGILTVEESEELITKYIKFIPTTVSESSLRHLYCAVDLYVSPYLAEGFNLMVLEAIACETRVLVSKGGSTDDFTLDILKNVKGSEDYIFLFETSVKTNSSTGDKSLEIDVNKILKRLSDIQFSKLSELNYSKYLKSYITRNLSWEAIAKQFYEYLNDIVNGSLLKQVYSETRVSRVNNGDEECDVNQEIKDALKLFINDQ